jgi:hypothetical protein
MFKFILRWTMNLIAIVFIGFVGFLTVEANQKTSKEVAIENKIIKEKAEKAKIEADRIYNLPENVEARAIAKYEDVALDDCTNQLRAIAKYPTKVDFDWSGASKRTYKNFSVEPVTHRIIVGRTGEAMNSLGLMVPFNGVCKYNYKPGNTTTPIVRIEVLM